MRLKVSSRFFRITMLKESTGRQVQGDGDKRGMFLIYLRNKKVYRENTLSCRLYFSCQGVLHGMSGAT